MTAGISLIAEKPALIGAVKKIAQFGPEVG